MTDLITIAEKFGLQIALVAFFVWRDWVRERYLSQRLDQVQEARTAELAGVIRDNAEATRESAEASRGLTAALNARPCMMQAHR
jgi:hypothetical protein